MAWQLVSAPTPVVKFLATGGRVRWNDAAQELMGYPERIDFLYSADSSMIGFRAGNQYVVGVSDADELRYEIVISDALDTIGLSLAEDYEVTPQLVDHSEGEIAGMVGGVSIPMPE